MELALHITTVSLRPRLVCDCQLIVIGISYSVIFTIDHNRSVCLDGNFFPASARIAEQARLDPPRFRRPHAWSHKERGLPPLQSTITATCFKGT